MPNNKMERFTQRARRVLSLAQEEAERLRHNTIGTEHMLLGLLREEGGIAGRVLRDLGLEQGRLSQLIEELSRSTVSQNPTTAELSSDCKRVLELSVDEARRMGHHYLGTEHLLLGLVRQEDSVAVGILKQLGISPSEVRRQTRRVLQESPAQPNQPNVDIAVSWPPADPAVQRQPMTRLPADAYELLENVLMKILEMIEAGKLPIAQGVELFSTLTPDLKLARGQQAELISHLFDQKKFNDYKVQLKAIDSKGVETISETDIPLPTVLAEIDRFLAAAINAPDMPLTFKLGDSSLEVRIEKGEDQA